MEQNEIDELLKGIDLNDKSDSNLDPVEDENLGWDDVQEELMQSQAPPKKVEVSPVNFDEMPSAPSVDAQLNLDFILDIPLTLSVELGRCQMLISELLQLGQGSIIELAKLAGEPMDVYVNQRLIARGEVVVVNEKFGIRLTDIVSQAERVKKLR
ncbi:MAG: Flagellar motor switch protein FliN [Syntrophus sp. PtaU1.Bin005]|jgi:flagellar motor switch protein FliN/FliY|nr:MAG: Flagellar motor switch protein FliN [Syntrophus sp. PtaB.Bin138]OPY83208.1 MAG: Flagellar motor switch protein FliN [Syntrophus sp. PtaU1.Bin005]